MKHVIIKTSAINVWNLNVAFSFKTDKTHDMENIVSKVHSTHGHIKKIFFNSIKNELFQYFQG